MILSMTGFGRSVKQWEEKTITVEVKSLNSKITDLKIRIPQRYREKEMDIRSLVMSQAERGRIELSIDTTSPDGGMDYSINKSLFKYYYKDLQQEEFLMLSLLMNTLILQEQQVGNTSMYLGVQVLRDEKMLTEQ